MNNIFLKIIIFFLLIYHIKSLFIEVCGGIIDLSPGDDVTITSPNYPKNYDVDKICVWLLRVNKVHYTPYSYYWCLSNFRELRNFLLWISQELINIVKRIVEKWHLHAICFFYMKIILDMQKFWFVFFLKAPPTKHVKIHSDVFHLPYNTVDNRCYHWLEVRYNLIGQQGVRYVIIVRKLYAI